VPLGYGIGYTAIGGGGSTTHALTSAQTPALQVPFTGSKLIMEIQVLF
jgi:hypothetical protein